MLEIMFEPFLFKPLKSGRFLAATSVEPNTRVSLYLPEVSLDFHKQVADHCPKQDYTSLHKGPFMESLLAS